MKHQLEIEITGIAHDTWQGLLHTPEGTVPFHSELELMLELERCVCVLRGSELQCGSETGNGWD